MLFAFGLTFLIPAVAAGNHYHVVTGDAARLGTSSALVRLVGGIYKPFVSSDPYSAPEPPDLVDAIAPFASSTLKALLSAQQQCEIKSQGECGLNWDVVVDGQDWEIPEAPHLVSTVIASDRIDVLSSFTSLGHPIAVRYIFRRKADGWRLDDIRGSSSDGKFENWSLRRMLTQSLGGH
ncbi:hypothetical protein [Acidisoma sp. S159]|uniref:hypothetical protein n=1 Tax=Acidisoma sp. S159 TaxID=1747225 RepID=UPI00131D3342|nr:hypothetical protein [Acidisoma sp. S159]